MSRIYKYNLTESLKHEMPAGSVILHAGIDPGGDICVWAWVHNNIVTMDEWSFEVIGTGWDIDDSLENVHRGYVGTVHEGSFVWHVFTLMEIINEL
jgi:hypothetical protein